MARHSRSLDTEPQILDALICDYEESIGCDVEELSNLRAF